MDIQTKTLLREITDASDHERMSFPDIVKALADVGIERYHADLVSSTKTYYTQGADAEVVACHGVGAASAQTFVGDDIHAAVRASQAQEIKYREFCSRIAAAGCVGYFVTLVGRRAIYYGRNGDSHTEWFPGAK